MNIPDRLLYRRFIRKKEAAKSARMDYSTWLLLLSDPKMAGIPAHITAAGLEWVSASSSVRSFPDGAVKAGHRGNLAPYAVGRVLAPDGKYHPAKVFIGDGADAPLLCHYYYNNTETSAPSFEVLVTADASRVTLEWVKASNGEVPAYAVQSEANELYVGRYLVSKHNELVIGEVQTKENRCVVVTCMQVFPSPVCEVLCAIPHASTATSK